jgi:hypothetical protein
MPADAGGTRPLRAGGFAAPRLPFASLRPRPALGGAFARWPSDSRRLLFAHERKLYLVDSESRRVREMLGVAPHRLSPVLTLSRDDRLMAFALRVTEADVWMMSLAR